MKLTADNLELLLKAGVAVLGLIAVVMLVILLVRKQKLYGTATKRKKVFTIVISVFLAAVIIVLNVATSIYAFSLNSVFTKPSDGDDSITTTEKEWRSLATEIANEGMVLMTNEDKTLPLESGTKINLLGYCAYNSYLSGSGSGSASASDSISIQAALEMAGFEINPDLAKADIFPDRPKDSNPFKYTEGDIFIGEPEISSYSGNISFEEQKKYSDTAVVVLGRSGGEGFDLNADPSIDALELTQNEKDLMQKATETFETVIVVLNCANAIQMDVLLTYDIDAMVWAGLPGPYGFEALGSILNGSVNPSGNFGDTWVYDQDSAPAFENYGENRASNAEESYYVDYVEGIYVGYKWYETAYAEGAVITNTKTGKTFDYSDYDSIVAFPFGYGLSYTTFNQKIVSAPDTVDPKGSVSFDVEVTNTGDIAGKETVQIYVTVPYTDYDKANGIEKSAVSLIGIGKTEMLEPGETEIVTVTANVEDFSSYASNYKNADGTYGAYMLDAGEYVFMAGENVHKAYDSVTATLEKDYFYSGEQKRAGDKIQASNQFDEVARGEYLSRKDKFANYESAMNSVSDVVTSTDWEDHPNTYDEALDDVVDHEYTKGVDYAVDGDLTVEDVKGLDYDDETWDKLVAQMTLEELFNLGTDATYQSIAVESIGKGATTDSDGPLGITSIFNPDLNSVAYPCIPLLTATFNANLAEKLGEYVADQAHDKGVTGWYAPAMDIHRTGYSGRNFEYYSEDGMLSGLIAQATVSGARSRDMIVYIKHFALNDQETHRGKNLHTYSNEQAIREIYLKPFELSVKNGNATAIMTSMNYIGDTYAGASIPLLEKVLRGEWGFRGKSLTDMDEGKEAVNFDACLRAGTDAWLTVNDIEMPKEFSSADIYYLQRAAKNILFTESTGNTYPASIVNWHNYVILITVELICIMAIVIAAYLVRRKKVQSVNE